MNDIGKREEEKRREGGKGESEKVEVLAYR